MRPWAALTAVLLLTTSSARAAPEPGGAEALFEQGRALVLAGRFAEGCPRLAQSLQLDRGIGTMLWLADCYEKDGQLAAAWTQFKDAAAFAASHEDGRASVAQRRAAKLEDQLTRIIVVLLPNRNVDGLLVHRDGVPVASHELQSGSIVLPVQPGAHTVTATAPGRTPWRVTLVVPTTPGAVTVEIPLLVVAPTVADAVNAVVAAPLAPTPPPPGSSWMRVTGVSLGVAGLAAAAAGAYFGLHASSTYDASNADGHCSADQTCDARGKQLREDATSTATLSTVAFGASAGALVAGIVLYVLAPSSRPSSPVAITPALSPRVAGLSLARTF